MGVVSACLPSLRPLFKKIISGTYKGPTFRSLTTGATKTLGTQDYASGTHGLHSHHNHHHPHNHNALRHIWSRNGGREFDDNNGGALSSMDDPGDLQSFTRLEELDGPWGHNVHVQGGRNTACGRRDHQLPTNNNHNHIHNNSNNLNNAVMLDKKGAAGTGSGIESGSDDQISMEEMNIPSRRIKVKTEVTLISTQRLDYRDHLF